MCEFCENREIPDEHGSLAQKAIYEKDNIVVQVDVDTPIGRRRGEGGTMTIYTPEIFRGPVVNIVPIQYCPMCGRKLNDSEIHNLTPTDDGSSIAEVKEKGNE